MPGVLVEDALFATLDPTTRRTTTQDGRVYTLSDTVGFVRHLPHQLVEAFRSTLEEVADADLIVHVVDGSHPDPEGQLAAVREVFAEIGADKVPELVVINKADAADPLVLARLRAAEPHSVVVSAKTGEGIADVLAAIEGDLPRPERGVRGAAALRPRRPAQPDPHRRRGRGPRAHRRRARSSAAGSTPTWPGSSRRTCCRAPEPPLGRAAPRPSHRGQPPSVLPRPVRVSARVTDRPRRPRRRRRGARRAGAARPGRDGRGGRGRAELRHPPAGPGRHRHRQVAGLPRARAAPPPAGRRRDRDAGAPAPARRAGHPRAASRPRSTSCTAPRRTPWSRGAATTPACTGSARACRTTRARSSRSPQGSLGLRGARAARVGGGAGRVRRPRRPGLRAAAHRPGVAPGVGLAPRVPRRRALPVRRGVLRRARAGHAPRRLDLLVTNHSRARDRRRSRACRCCRSTTWW